MCFWIYFFNVLIESNTTGKTEKFSPESEGVKFRVKETKNNQCYPQQLSNVNCYFFMKSYYCHSSGPLDPEAVSSTSRVFAVAV